MFPGIEPLPFSVEIDPRNRLLRRESTQFAGAQGCVAGWRRTSRSATSRRRSAAMYLALRSSRSTSRTLRIGSTWYAVQKQTPLPYRSRSGSAYARARSSAKCMIDRIPGWLERGLREQAGGPFLGVDWWRGAHLPNEEPRRLVGH
jgi:hypothetical protein